MERILNFLKDNHVFFYATVDGDKPRVRPFGFYMEYGGKLYIGMGKQKESYRQTIINPNVELCASSPDGKWVRIRGKALEDLSEGVISKAFEVFPSLSEMYNKKTGHEFACFYISEGVAEFADMSGNFEKITL